MEKQEYLNQIKEVHELSLQAMGMVGVLAQANFDDENVRMNLSGALNGAYNVLETLNEIMLELDYTEE